jgi:DNA repair exonuclease SbcCD nuclease subunit
MARIAFIGDCHLGYRHRSKAQRLLDFARAFEDAVDKAVALSPDVVVFLGDLVHHSKPDPVSLRTVLRKLMFVADRCPVVVCIGNHEIEGHLGTTYSPIYGDVHENIHVLSSESPHTVLELGGNRYGFHGFEFTRSRESAEEKLKGVTLEAKADVNILCLHQAVEGYLSPHELSLAALRQAAQSYDLIMLGHVHKHQRIGEVFDVAPAYYCGSTERVSFNEAENMTGFMFFSSDDFADPRFIESDSAPMAYSRFEFKGTPTELNLRIGDAIGGSDARLLKVEVQAELDGDYMDVRRDWEDNAPGRTIVEVVVAPRTHDAGVRLERAHLNEDLIREYFQKSGTLNGELEEMCVELFRRYGG